MSVKAKFRCHEVSGSDEQKEIKFSAVTEGSEENKDWSKWTPSGDLRMSVSNPDAFNQFETGKEYILNIEEA